MSFKYKVQQGDTLNKIANKHGFRNYKDAGISSVPSGNFDLIRAGEEVSLDNYNPNNIQSLPTPTPPVLSSKDNAQEFNDNRNKLDNILAGQRPEDNGNKPIDIKPIDKPIETKQPKPDNTQVINDPLYLKSRADDQAKIDTARTNMEQDKTDYLASITTRLADVDAVTKSAIDRITATAERRINEQNRINAVNTDRVRAYGLGRGGAEYKPIMFSDAVTERERKGADEIARLERERDTAIREAETAGRLGKSAILKEKLSDLNDIEDRMRERFGEIEAESEKQYQTLRTLRKEKEVERLKKVKDMQERLQAFVSLHSDEYQNMSDEEIEQKVAEVMRAGLSYSEAYSAIMDGMQVDFDAEKSKASIAKTKAEVAKIKEQTKTEAQKGKTEQSKQYKNYKDADKEDSKDDLTTTQKQKIEQAGLGDASRKQKLDFLHGEAGGDSTVYSERQYAEDAEVGEIVILNGKMYKKSSDKDFDPVE
jgi:hypothetical protein